MYKVSQNDFHRINLYIQALGLKSNAFSPLPPGVEFWENCYPTESPVLLYRSKTQLLIAHGSRKLHEVSFNRVH